MYVYLMKYLVTINTFDHLCDLDWDYVIELMDRPFKAVYGYGTGCTCNKWVRTCPSTVWPLRRGQELVPVLYSATSAFQNLNAAIVGRNVLEHEDPPLLILILIDCIQKRVVLTKKVKFLYSGCHNCSMVLFAGLFYHSYIHFDDVDWEQGSYY